MTSSATRRYEQQDISLLLATPKYRALMGFIESCVVLGNFVKCDECGRVIGVGMTQAEAADDVHTNKTGGWYDGGGRPSNAGWRCNDDLPVARPRPPVPMVKHKRSS